MHCIVLPKMLWTKRTGLRQKQKRRIGTMRCFAEDDMIKENRVKTNTKEENRHNALFRRRWCEQRETGPHIKTGNCMFVSRERESAGGLAVSHNDQVWRERDVYCRVKRTFYGPPSHPCSLSCCNEKAESANTTYGDFITIFYAVRSFHLLDAELYP